MASTTLIKFCVFIAHSKPNNMTLSAFPAKIPETRKIVLIFSPSPNVAPKLNDQSLSNSISRVPLQISLALFFVSYLPSKLRVVHNYKKKCKIFIFSKMAPNFVHLLYIRTPRIWHNRLFPKKNFVTRIIFFIFYVA